LNKKYIFFIGKYQTNKYFNTFCADCTVMKFTEGFSGVNGT